MSAAQNLLRGSLLRTVDLFILLAASFWVTPLLVHALGHRLYGFWTLTGAIVGYYGFLDLGLAAAATKYMSEALGRDDAAELDSVASTAYFLFCAAALVVLAATVLCALAAPLFVRDPQEAALVQKLIVTMGVAAAIGFPAKVYAGMLMAGIRYDHIAAISISRSLILNAAIAVSLRAGLGILAVALITCAVSLLQRGAVYAVCKARFPRLKIALSSLDRAKIRVMLVYGSKMLVCQVGDVLRFRLDAVVIASFLGASLVTPYVIAVRLAEGFAQLVSSFTGTMLPVFSRYQGREDADAVRGALLKVTKLSAVITTYVGLSAIFYGRAFILRWMGPGFDDSRGVAAILCAAYLIGLPQSPGIQLLYGLSKHKVYAVLSVCEGLLNLALSVAFLKLWGIYGVALGTLVEMAVFKLLILPHYICRAIDLPLRAYLVDAILQTQLKTAVPLALYFYFIAPFVAPDYRVLAACVGVQTALFVPTAYFFILGDGERETVAGAVRGLIRRERPALTASAKG